MNLLPKFPRKNDCHQQGGRESTRGPDCANRLRHAQSLTTIPLLLTPLFNVLKRENKFKNLMSYTIKASWYRPLKNPLPQNSLETVQLLPVSILNSFSVSKPFTSSSQYNWASGAHTLTTMIFLSGETCPSLSMERPAGSSCERMERF